MVPETVEITVFRFNELSDTVKNVARNWYREGALDDDGFDFVCDDFETVCALLGVTLRTSTVRLLGGGTRAKPNIYFRGF